jgi:GAF domain-containing protein
MTNDPYRHPTFNADVDTALGFKTRNILCAPILKQVTGDSNSGEEAKGGGNATGRPELLGVVEVINKSEGPFTANDQKLCEMLADHVSIFLEKSEGKQ